MTDNGARARVQRTEARARNAAAHQAGARSYIPLVVVAVAILSAVLLFITDSGVPMQ